MAGLPRQYLVPSLAPSVDIGNFEKQVAGKLLTRAV
jgi:hypothetical protein